MAMNAIIREARFLTKRNKKRFSRKFRRAWNNGGKARLGAGKSGYKKNGEDMRTHTLA